MSLALFVLCLFPIAAQAGSLPALPPPSAPVPDCVPGSNRDFTVGPGHTFAELHDVPWESLMAGDSVRIYWRAVPYKGKFMVGAKGSAASPVHICGVRGADGSRPIITGDGASTRAALLNEYGSASARDVHQSRGIVMVKQLGSGVWDDFPTYIDIFGLDIRSGHPNYSYTDAAGTSKKYVAFGACVWLERGQNIRIMDNSISDCSQGIFTKSTDDGAYAITKNIVISHNTFSNNGIVDDFHMHTTYTASWNIIFEFNTYLPLRAGATGNGPKDRSVYSVFRYNDIRGGAHAIDMVEAQDFPQTAVTLPEYRTTLVYGNVIEKDGETGSLFHYGGDSYGAAAGDLWGERFFRKGTLWFFDNTVTITGLKAELFQLDTTEERAEVFNNVFYFAPGFTTGYMRMRAFRENVAAPLVDGGILNLGRNWITTGWTDTDPFHTVRGQLITAQPQVTGTTPPAGWLVPLAPRNREPALTAPTVAPTTAPTAAPTAAPTVAPTRPTVAPTAAPTAAPTRPTAAPTVAPTRPTAAPTIASTIAPTVASTVPPTTARTVATRQRRRRTVAPRAAILGERSLSGEAATWVPIVAALGGVAVLAVAVILAVVLVRRRRARQSTLYSPLCQEAVPPAGILPRASMDFHMV